MRPSLAAIITTCMTSAADRPILSSVTADSGDSRELDRPQQDLVLRGCRVSNQGAIVDIAVSGGRVTAMGQGLSVEAPEELNVAGRLVVAAFVEPHIHLDKVSVAPLLGANRSGTLSEAIDLLHQTKSASTVDEIADRAGHVIEMAVLAGTTVIRSHVDVDTIGGLKPLHGVLKAAHEHRDICDVQVVAFPQEGIRRDPGADELMRQAMAAGAHVVGGMPHWEATPDDASAHVRFCMDLARVHDADVDMHIDETDDPSSRTFEMLVDATEAYGWQGRVTAGHCCAMAAWDAAYRANVIRRAAKARVNVITNPATNLMLQGRLDEEPRRRGLPPIKELMAAGVNVACGQDCVQDAFYPFGVADPLQVALILCHAAHLSTTDEIDAALEMIGANAASVLRLHEHGLRVGALADLVVLDADESREALRTQAVRRWVIRRGKVVAETSTSRHLHREPAAVAGAAATREHKLEHMEGER
jgi:cytosine deaminase